MAGPLPLPIEHSASSYGEEAEIQQDISAASQYNPATKLGITNADQPSTKAETIPSSADILKNGLGNLTGLGPSSGLDGEKPPKILPQPKPYSGPQPFASYDVAEHKTHLSRLTNISPAMQEYLSGT